MDNRKTLIVGITGIVGSGKSSAARFIAENGFPVIFTDDKAKAIINSDEAVRLKLIEAFGIGIFQEGKLNNKMLSGMVFGNTEENSKALHKLNSIVHPPVIDFMIEEVERFEKSGAALVFVESALIFEAGLDEGFDYIIVVDSDTNTAIERTSQRTGLSTEEVRLRMKEQLSGEEKRKLADFVIENNGSLEDLKKTVNFIVNIISQL